MLDRDFVKIYGVAAKVLKQSVKRSLQRFPAGFMLETTDLVFKNWRSQFVTSNFDQTYHRHLTSLFHSQYFTSVKVVRFIRE